MDDDISNINNVTRFRPYDGKNESQGKKRKKKKKHDDEDVQDEDEQDEDSVTNANIEDDKQGDSEGDDVGHNLDVDM